MTENAFLELDGDVYVGRDPARGPWAAEHCHAGPVAAAVARSFEHAFGDDRRLVRLTLDLIRPAPMAGFRVAVKVTRNGRRLSTAVGEMTDLEGKTCAAASAMFIAALGPQDLPTAPVEPPDPEAAEAGLFPIQDARHDRPFITNFIETRLPPGQNNDPGPSSLWMKTPPLLAGETPSAFQRLCPLADSGNALARNAEITEYSFLNSDLTIVCHRASEEAWLHSEAVSHWGADGIGLAEARISDRRGPIATALQSLVIGPV